MAHFSLDSGWTNEVREFGEEAIDRCATSDGLDAGDQRAGGVFSALLQDAEIRKKVHANEGM
jgi:hypothetical protein